jgi:hypothetical protein
MPAVSRQGGTVKRPAGVVAAAVVLALVSLFQIVMALCVALAAVVDKGRAAAPSAAAAAAPVPGFLLGMGVFSLLLAAWGIATTIGLFRLHRWARVSILVIGGCMAFLALCSMLALLVVLFIHSTPPGMDPSQARNMQMMASAFLAFAELLYAVMLGIGVWWLVYFNRKKVRESFDGSPGAIVESRRPLLISVYAILVILGALAFLAMAFGQMPGVFLWVVLHGWVKAAFYLIYFPLSVAAGIGLWRLKEWARRLALALLGFGAVQTIIYLLNPSLMLRISAETHQVMDMAQPEMPEHLRRVMYTSIFSFSLLLMIAIALMLHYYRDRFQEPSVPLIDQPTPPV